MDFISQQRAINFLEKSIEKNRVSHAYLFSGQLYSGKENVALKFAKSLLCEKNGCGVCDSCESFENRIHPDFIEIKKQDEETGISDIRYLKKQFISKPLLSKKKVAIIFDADYLTREAQNSSLKILEECPANGIIILLCQNADNLLKTIVSRSVFLNFQQASFLEIEKKFGNKIANFSFGLVELAEKLKSDEIFLNEFFDYFKKIQNIYLISDFDKLVYAEELSKDLQKCDQSLKFLQIFLRARLLNKIGIGINHKITAGNENGEKLSELISSIKKILEADYLLKNNSINKKLVLEELMLNL